MFKKQLCVLCYGQTLKNPHQDAWRFQHMTLGTATLGELAGRHLPSGAPASSRPCGAELIQPKGTEAKTQTEMKAPELMSRSGTGPGMAPNRVPSPGPVQ